MDAKILTLTSARRGPVRCQETGVVFPVVYRVTGYYHKLREGAVITHGCLVQSNDDLVPDLDSPDKPSYTLDTEPASVHYANPIWKSIQTLDPAVDSGYVFVRHHRSRESMSAYIDCV